MMNIFDKISWRIRLLKTIILSVRIDHNKLMYQKLFNDRLYIRGVRDLIDKDKIAEACETIYFKKYMPKNGDCIVDFGFGLGHEYAWLESKKIDVRVLGVEIQPIIYELACNSFKNNRRYKFDNRFLSEADEGILISSSSDYTTVGGDEAGCIPVYSVTPDKFWDTHKIEVVDLLKMNIEGGEVFVLPIVLNSIIVNRLIISAHDFRADRGEGENYRTREKIIYILQQNGFECSFIADKGKLRDWIYAEKLPNNFIGSI